MNILKKITLIKSIIMIIFQILLLSSCTDINDNLSIINLEKENSSFEVLPIAWGEILFSEAKPKDHTIENRLLSLIDNAETSINIAIYNLTLASVTNSLVDAHNRGVIIKIIIDKGALKFRSGENNYLISKLENGGIEIRQRFSSGIMHHKFAIIDANTLWTGSGNFTSGGVFFDNNNALIISEPKIVEAFQQEFNSLWNSDKTTNNNNSKRTLIDNSNFEAYFSSSDDVQAIIIDKIKKAESEILILMYSFTDEEIAKAIINQYELGAEVMGIVEYEGSGSKHSQLNPLYCAILNMRTDGNENLMHHKVIIIDRETVLTGSYNYSESANLKNDENLLIINDINVANYFINQFELLWNEAQILNPNWVTCE
jgi:phosphatidylserine/phosphatidylglycerophosphate/cardiolipin synthase-like enzyme